MASIPIFPKVESLLVTCHSLTAFNKWGSHCIGGNAHYVIWFEHAH